MLSYHILFLTNFFIILDLISCDSAGSALLFYFDTICSGKEGTIGSS